MHRSSIARPRVIYQIAFNLYLFSLTLLTSEFYTQPYDKIKPTAAKFEARIYIYRK